MDFEVLGWEGTGGDQSPPDPAADRMEGNS